MENMNSSNGSLGTPFGFLKAAIEHVPAVRYAVGVGGIAAIVSIVLTVWKLNVQAAVIGTLVVFIFMVVLVVFVALSKVKGRVLRPLSLFLAWAFLLLSVLVACLFISCAFFDYPKTLPCLLKGEGCGPNPITAKRYVSASGSLEKDGDSWYERFTQSPQPFATFKELNRDKDYIYLVDYSRQKPDSQNNFFHLRIPIAGGVVRWSWENPMYWIDLYIVKPE